MNSMPPSPDRVRTIRRSTRCFAFGIMGMTPLLGMGAAWLALRLWRQLAEESKAHPHEWNPARHLALWGVRLAYVGLALSSIIILWTVAGMFQPAGK